MAERSLNKVQILGRLGRDPELRYTTTGQAVATISVATSHRYEQNGEWKEQTEWHRLVAWGRQAEVAGEYLQKGSQAYFEGRLQTRKWKDREDRDQYTTEIVVREMILLGGKGQGSGNYPPHPADEQAGDGTMSAPTHSGPAPATPPGPAMPAVGVASGDPNDDIPF